MNKQIIVGVGVVAVLVIGYFLANQPKTDDLTPIVNNTTSSTKTNPVATASSESVVKEFTVDGSSYKFNPETITVNKGDKVKIIFRDTSGPHNLVIEGYNVQTKVLGSGEEESVEFVADKLGTFEYYCSVGNHRQMGMKGTLIIE